MRARSMEWREVGSQVRSLEVTAGRNNDRQERAKGVWTTRIPSGSWLEQRGVIHCEGTTIWINEVKKNKECSYAKKDQGHHSCSVVVDWLIENIRKRWVSQILLIAKPIASWVTCDLRKVTRLETRSHLTGMEGIQQKKISVRSK